MLGKRVNPKSNKKEYCLLSRDGKKVLEYFGVKKPSKERYNSAERRVEYYKHQSA